LEEKNTFELTFITNFGELATIRIPFADPICDEADLTAAMNQMIASSIILLSNGRPIAREKAELVTVVSNEFDLS